MCIGIHFHNTGGQKITEVLVLHGIKMHRMNRGLRIIKFSFSFLNDSVVGAYVIILFSLLFLPQWIIPTDVTTLIGFSWGGIWPNKLNPIENLTYLTHGGKVLRLFYFILAYIIISMCAVLLYLRIKHANKCKYELIIRKIMTELIIIYIVFPILFILKVLISKPTSWIGGYLILLPPFNLSAVGVILGLWNLFSPPNLVERREVIDIFRRIQMDDELSRMYRDLLEIYRVKYPHNPEGVLKYHINKELKSGIEVDLTLKRLMQRHKVNQ